VGRYAGHLIVYAGNVQVAPAVGQGLVEDLLGGGEHRRGQARLGGVVLDLLQDRVQRADRAGAGDQVRSAIRGPRCFQIAELAMELSRVFCTSSRSRPLRRASAIASAAATVCTASSRLATYFSWAPVPNAPV
jgi:hypothetical protein